MDCQSRIIVAGTGHRPQKLGGFGPDIGRRLLALVMPWLAENRPDEVISGMALGYDQALAEAAIHLGIPVTAAVPFDGQEARWPDAARARYRSILAKASRLVVVSPGGYAAAKLFTRNEWMVDQCTMLLALFDGSPAGGTAAAIDYAQRRQKPIENLWARWIALGAERHR